MADPAAVLRQRQSLPGKAKAMVAVRALAGPTSGRRGRRARPAAPRPRGRPMTARGAPS